MIKIVSRKGISLVALVITIIVLVVLTGAVVITGVNVPQQGQLAVFKTNVSSIQDAVTLKMLNNMVENASLNSENVKWIGVASGYTEASIANPPKFGWKINGVKVVALDTSLKNEMQIKDEEFEKYYVDEKGTVYHTGFTYDGITYYNASESRNVTEIVLPNVNWTASSLNVEEPYKEEIISEITYYAPIPKGFNVVEGTIATGLVIQDRRGNQFVWVPVNASYTMKGDVTGNNTFGDREKTNYNYDIPYLSNDNTTALAYWEASANGHSGTITSVGTYSEPYTGAGAWEIAEYQAMVTSVLKYGGFYVGRYETGGTASVPVVQAEVLPITSIGWGHTNIMDAEPTSGAVYVARNMYGSSRTDVGVRSTLIYGIQWDSIMCWAPCYNATTPRKNSVGDTGTVSTDCYKNIYDLAGNVLEWSMEAKDTSNRGWRGGRYNGAYAVSNRGSFDLPSAFDTSAGFRIALYVK